MYITCNSVHLFFFFSYKKSQEIKSNAQNGKRELRHLIRGCYPRKHGVRPGVAGKQESEMVWCDTVSCYYYSKASKLD